MKKLNTHEIEEFTKKYLPIWGNDIQKVTCIEYKKIFEYLVNDHYLVIVNGSNVETKDLQELIYK